MVRIAPDVWIHDGVTVGADSKIRRDAEIFEDAEAGDFRIRADSPIAGADIGPASLR